jgi:hypothetical protein
MIYRRILGSLTAVAVGAAVILYTGHPAKSSDHQDTFNLATRANTSPDITDVYVFPSPANTANVVLAMDVSPLIPAGMGTSYTFDPSVMWQFKISHGTAAGSPEDQVIQFGVTGTGTSQVITMYGPAAPHEVSTSNTFVPTISGSFSYNKATLLTNGVKVFAGPRADPFYFDLFGFFAFLGDRNWGVHSAQGDSDAPYTPLYNGDANGNPNAAPEKYSPTYDKAENPAMPTFNGFPAGTVSNVSGGNSPLGNYACSTNPASNTLVALGGFNVLSFVVELPKSMLTNGYTSSTIHVWATANSSSGT